MHHFPIVSEEPFDPRDVLAAPGRDVANVLAANHRAFLAFLERRVGSRDVAEDLLQDAFARGLDKLETLRDDEAVVAWFYRALRNALVDHARRAGAAARALERFAGEMPTEAPPPELEAEVCRCVLSLTETLKPDYAAALRRVELEGVPVKVFAEEQGITSNAAGVRVFRAREALRRQVAASCGTCATHGCIACTCKKKENER